MPYSSAILVQGAKKVSRFLGSEQESVSTRVFTGFLLAGFVGRQVVGRAIASVFAAQIVFFVTTLAPDAFQAPDGFQ